jgi:hypothetical protein
MTTVSQNTDRCQHVKNSLFHWPDPPSWHTFAHNPYLFGPVFNKCTGYWYPETGLWLVKELIVIIPLLRNFKSEIV